MQASLSNSDEKTHFPPTASNPNLIPPIPANKSIKVNFGSAGVGKGTWKNSSNRLYCNGCSATAHTSSSVNVLS